MKQSWVLWTIAGCGLVFFGAILAQLVWPGSPSIWIGLPFGVAGGILARIYTLKE